MAGAAPHLLPNHPPGKNLELRDLKPVSGSQDQQVAEQEPRPRGLSVMSFTLAGKPAM